MSIETKVLPNEPVIIISVTPPIKTPDDAVALYSEVVKFKRDAGVKPVYRVLDFSRAQLHFSDMMVGMAAERGQEGGYSDPEVRTVFVGTDEMVEFGVKALQNQTQYSAANIVGMFTSVDDAVAFVRQHLVK